MQQITVLTVGGALIDLFLKLHDEEKVVFFDPQKETVALPLGAKILLDSCDPRVGGNACNVAVGLQRLGIKSSIMAEIASDEFSEKIINDLKKESVDISHIVRGPGQTSLNIAINFHKDRTLFTNHQKRDHLFNFDFATEWIYLTSLGDRWEHVYEEVASLVRTKKVRLAFNPGSVQFSLGVSSFLHILPLVEILFVNKQEAEKIVGKHDRSLDLVRALVHKGVKIPVVTNGEEGAYTVDESGKFFHLASEKTLVVERTGAGDAFASGFMSAYILKRSIREASRWGMYNSLSVIGEVGAQTGLLHRERMEEQIK